MHDARLELEIDGRRHRVRAGERCTFGRGEGVDVVLAHDHGLHRHCGTIEVVDDGWDLHNAGRWLQLRVVALGRPGFDSLPPGETLRVPWSDARIEVFSGTRWYSFVARFVAPEPGGRPPSSPVSIRIATPADRGDPGDIVTSAAVRLDRSSGYFRALVALCEPRLRDPATSRVATDLEIARRLNRLPVEPARLTGKTVERRLDNCRRHFGLKAPPPGVIVGEEHGDARRRLVDLALLTGAVTEHDLAVLEPRATAGRGRVR